MSSSHSSAQGGPTAPWGLLVLRVVIGVVFVVHGWGKITGWDQWLDTTANLGLPMPTVAAALALVAEFGGGIALILGLLTRVAALPLAFTMLVAGYTVHSGAFLLKNNGFEYTLVLGAACVCLILAGGGALSIDGIIAKRKSASKPS